MIASFLPARVPARADAASQNRAACRRLDTANDAISQYPASRLGNFMSPRGSGVRRIARRHGVGAAGRDDLARRGRIADPAVGRDPPRRVAAN